MGTVIFSVGSCDLHIVRYGVSKTKHSASLQQS